MRYNIGDKVLVKTNKEPTIRTGVIKEIGSLDTTPSKSWYLIRLDKEYEGEKGRYKWFLEEYIVNSLPSHVSFDEVENEIFDSIVKNVVPVDVKKIIFSGPKTIVLWADGTKTIVSKSEDEEYFDPIAAFCAAYTKKMFGSMNKVRKTIRDKSNIETYNLDQPKKLIDKNEAIKKFNECAQRILSCMH